MACLMAGILGCGAGTTLEKHDGFIHGVEVTTATKNDASELEVILPDALGDLCGHGAYQGNRSERIRAPGSASCHKPASSRYPPP